MDRERCPVRVGLKRYIDTPMYRDMDLADTRIDTLGTVSRYFQRFYNIKFCFIFTLK